MIYLQVERIERGLSRIPVQMSGPQWATTASAASPQSASEASPEVGFTEAVAASVLPHKVFLPLVYHVKAPIEPDDPTGCSAKGGCGWFTSDGRMVDYIQASG